MSELPDDLLEEIFFRLPATSSNRLRSTCKRWNRLLTDTEFTRKHIEKAPKQFQSLMLKASGVCLMRINIRRFSPVKIKREASLSDPYSRVDQFLIWEISHCDGLLLCNMADSSRLVVWNPCTGQTKWIETRNRYETCWTTYALGSYQDKRSNGNSYKILRHIWNYNSGLLNYARKQEFEIYEINSNSWRILDVTIDFELDSIGWGVSLKGKTCWIGNRFNIDRCIVSFDYTAERFERLCLLPYQYDTYANLSLSVVREEKLALLLQRRHVGEKTEIWVTNKIRETKTVSLSKALAAYVPTCKGGSFLFDDEKKLLTVCETNKCSYGNIARVYIVGEDNRFRKVELKSISTRSPFLFNYVPSLIQLQQDISEAKEKGATD